MSDETYYHEVTIETRRPDGTTGVVHGEYASDKGDPQTAAEQIWKACREKIGTNIRQVGADR